MRKIIKKTFFVTLILLLSAKATQAAVDLQLNNYESTQEVSIIINSNESPIVGIDLPIIFSNNVEIEEVTKENYCEFFFNETVVENKLNIECFNSEEIVMNGVIAKIKYTTESSDYSFYIQETDVDLGGEQLGVVTNVNKPIVDSSADTNIENNIEEKQFFWEDNKLFVLLGIIAVVCLGVILFLLLSKSKDKIPSNIEEAEG